MRHSEKDNWTVGPCRLKRRGLSLVELMIALSISSMLLVAVAAAYSASSSMIQTNDRFFRATQAARVSMTQLLTELRRCDAVEIDGNELRIIRPAEILTPGELFRVYSYDSAGQRLTLSITDTDEVAGPQYTLASNISSASFVADSRLDEVQPGVFVNVVVRLTVTLVVDVDGTELRLSGSAVPRRAMVY